MITARLPPIKLLLSNMYDSPSSAASVSTEEFAHRLYARQNLPLAILAGAIASVVSAAAWAGITVLTHFQIGYLAVAIGFIVGFAVRLTGRGLTPVFGVVGAAFALVGCVLGNFLSQVGFYSVEEHVNFFEVLRVLDYSVVPQVMIETFHPMDVLFYGLALFAGYRYSFHQISDAELDRLNA